MSYRIALETYLCILNDFANAHNLPRLTDNAGTNTVVDMAKNLALPPIQSGVVPSALKSIMGSLLQNDQSAITGYYRPQVVPATDKVDMRSVVLPEAQPLTAIEEERTALWQRLQDEYKQLQVRTQPDQVREANIHALLQRYCWSLPAPVGGNSDVSLFDYARMSAALATCLVEAGIDAEEPALLIGADLSGVQDFLYTLSSDGAAKSLRGRSVYLQLLMEVIALDLLHELALPMANLLYVGGGNFYLIARPSQQKQIDDYQKLTSQRLLSMHEGALYMAIAVQTVAADNLSKTKVGEIWEGVADSLNMQKARRFSELDDEQTAVAIGTPLAGTGMPKKTCCVCQRSMLEDEEGVPITDDDVNADERKCDLCHSFDILGRDLSRAQFLALSRVTAAPATTVVTDWQKGLHHFGFDVQVLRDANQLQSNTGWEQQDSAFVHLSFWEGTPEISRFPGWPGDERTVWAYRPLAQSPPFRTDKYGNVLRDNSGYEILEDFDKLADHSEGINRWGVLRMDVDSLGDIFQKGMEPNASLSRVVSLSGLMRLFFEGYLPQIAKKYNENGKPRVHLMYAGGDDLFLVGSWSCLPELAKAIRDEFAAFACYNPKVTLSGGISIAPAIKYPLYQAAEDAHGAEQQAKRYGKNPDGSVEKNALVFLDEAMTWRVGTLSKPIYDSFERVWSRGQELRLWTDGKDAPLPRSFLMTLRSLDAEWREWKEREQGLKQNVPSRYKDHDEQLFLGPWLWNLVYSLHRAAQRTRDSDLIRDVTELATDIIAGEIRTIGLATRWVEYLTRKREN